ncbi:MAG: tRNA (adenosine(37)-N6)-threonylcarbamoyltransferase complex dimerization subunit type 1 TsaB [Phycisphaerales bacterium]|nr:tRNA (adenosine(37)-N6)-threonylcarbamoyltransferase complex dimerization subunit type 1 TsaB [Phycisphaerales bacterium]
MSLILAIETSNPASGKGAPSAGIALVEADGSGSVRPLDVEWLRTLGRHEDDLMPAVDRLAGRLGILPRSIDRVAVSLGPGGYTGLRVASTTGTMIAAALGAECIGVPTAEALARRSTGPGPKAVCLAVKGTSVWVHVFPGTGGFLLPVEQFPKLSVRTLVADAFLPESVREWAIGSGVFIEAPRYDPVAVAEACLDRVEAGPVLPLYAREPEAVTRWRTRGK